MANFELKFIDFADRNSYIKVESQVSSNMIFISGLDCNASELDGSDCKAEFSIWLDKSTAIKFAKTLRTEINKIESEF